MTDDRQKPLVSVITETAVGGVARHVELIAEELPKRGIQLQVILSCERRPDYLDRVDAFASPNVQVEVVPMLRRLAPISDWNAYTTIRSLLAATRPTVVHTHSSKAGILGRRAAASLGMPCLHTPHVFAFEWETGLRRMVYRQLERRAARWSDGLVALSDKQRRTMVDNRICSPEKIHLIPNGISTNLFHPPSIPERNHAREQYDVAADQLVIGVAARLEPQKGMGNALRAVVRVRDRFPKLVVLVAGHGSMAEECRRQAVALGIETTVRFCGEVEDMTTFYHALDCFMLASLWEGLPYVVLEAMACGLPVVSTRSFGCEGVLDDGETGIVVNCDDVDGLADAAITVLADPSKAGALGVQAREVVQRRFALDHWADELEALYRNLSGFHSRNG